MSSDNLPVEDCHYHLRKKKLEELKKADPSPDLLCVSVAWDWMYLGHTPRTVNREVSTTLLASHCCRKLRVACLGIPETSLLRLGQICSSHVVSRTEKYKKEEQAKTPNTSTRRRIHALGIQPVLDCWCKRQCSYLNFPSVSNKSGSKERTSEPVLDCQSAVIDAFGGDGWSCFCCSAELSNMYFHCIGCEKASSRSKDYNVCYACHENGEAKKSQRQHDYFEEHCSLYQHHIGQHPDNCQCGKQMNTCKVCNKCTKCCCICHSRFEMRCRFFRGADIKYLNGAVKSVTLEGQGVLEDQPNDLYDREGAVQYYLPDAIKKIDELPWSNR